VDEGRVGKGQLGGCNIIRLDVREEHDGHVIDKIQQLIYLLRNLHGSCALSLSLQPCLLSMASITNGHLLFVMGVLILKEFKNAKLDK